MTVVQTMLVFLGIPLGVFLVVGALVFGRSSVYQPERYRPGKPWTHAPAWYVPHREALVDAAPDRLAIEGASAAAAVAVGGASGEW